MIRRLSMVRIFCILLVTLAAVASVASFSLLERMGPLIWLPFCLALAAAILHTGAALLVWNGLQGFKAELRKAYLFICIALVFVGFTQLQLPIISILDWWELRENGVIVVPFVLPFIFFFIGIRRFARLLSVQTIWASPWLVNGVGLALGALLTLIPHAPNNTDPLQFKGTLVLLGWIAVHAFALMQMVLRVKKVIGVRYINAMAWLYITYVSVLLTTLAYIVTLLVTSPGDWYLDYNISVAPFVIVGLLWVRTSYAFNAVTAPQLSPNLLGAFFGPKTRTDSPYPSVDILIYIAEQVSDANAIDTILDDLRLVTAKNEPGQPLPPSEQSRLATVYMQLEDHLINKDRLRVFTAASLRENIELMFPPQALANSFWPLIAQKTDVAR